MAAPQRWACKLALCFRSTFLKGAKGSCCNVSKRGLCGGPRKRIAPGRPPQLLYCCSGESATRRCLPSRRRGGPHNCRLAPALHRCLRLLLSLQEFLGRPLPASVTIVEVGPRDGLQNEPEKVRQEEEAQKAVCPVMCRTLAAFLQKQCACGLVTHMILSGSVQVPTEVKVELIERLAAAGLPVVESTSFV